MNASDIAFLMTGDLHRNIRALKQLRSLSLAGYSVTVIHLGGSMHRVALPERVSEQVLNVPKAKGPRYFQAINKAFTIAASSLPARLYHASDLYVLPACSDAAKQWNGRYSFDSRELYTHVAATHGRPWVRWWWTFVEKKYVPGAACVFTVSGSIADHLETTYNIARPVVVHNAPEPHIENEPTGSEVAIQSISELLSERGLPSNVPVLVHLGQMKKDRGCKHLIRAMKSVKNAHLVFLGFGSIEHDLRKLVSKLHLSQTVHFIPPVSPRAVHAALQGATIGITMLEDSCLNHRFALPNKLFDYIHAGLPVLGSNLKEVASFVNEHQIGKTANPADSRSIANAINDMLSSPKLIRWSQNSTLVAETFSWDKASQRFMQEITRVLS